LRDFCVEKEKEKEKEKKGVAWEKKAKNIEWSV
jgi:hypothetical protein